VAQKEEMPGEQPANAKTPTPEQKVQAGNRLISKRVTDHLANERTFLAWIRTGLAIIAFGFVIERFGLLLRDLNVKISGQPVNTGHYSTAIGITLTLLGVLVMAVALLNFMQARRSIDLEQFHPHRGFAIFLTIITCLIGLILAVYLYIAA
jgi:putative membrane protein